MLFEFWGIDGSLYLAFPNRLSGFLAFGLAIVLGALILIRTHRQAGRRTLPDWLNRSLFVSLLLLAVVLSGLFVLWLPASSGAIPPGVPQAPQRTGFALLGALPWVLAAGFLGPLQAVLVGLLAGFVHGGWLTYRLLTPILVALQVLIYAWGLRRDYAEWPGRLARSPLFAGLFLGLLFGILGVLERFFYSSGSFYDGLDFALTQFGPTILAAVVPITFAGLIGEAFRYAFPEQWVQPRRLVAGPYNRSLGGRLVTMLAVIGALGGAVLLFGSWLLARDSALTVVAGQMQQTGDQVGRTVPHFVQTGRSFIRQTAAEIADLGFQQFESPQALERRLQRMPYFSDLALLDDQHRTQASTRSGLLSGAELPLELEASLRAALQGVPGEMILPSGAPESSLSFVFLSPLQSPDPSTTYGVVLAWTELAGNPFLKPAQSGLEAYEQGEVFVLDDRGRVVLHSQPAHLLDEVSLTELAPGEVQMGLAADGTRQLVYSSEVDGFPWTVVVTTPLRVVDQLALTLSTRLFVVSSLVGALMLAVVYVLSRQLTSPLRQMAATAEAITLGDLDQAVPAGGEDEVGRLATSFERMRRSLRSRLDELNLLLSTSQRMASSFELRSVLPPILEGIRALTEAEIVRLVISTQTERGAEKAEVYAVGEEQSGWISLDDQVLELCRQRGAIVLENPNRARAVLDLETLKRPLEAMLALPLLNEDHFVGTLWLAHHKAHVFSKDEIQTLTILTSQMGVSVANARLYHHVEQERLRLGAILEATPDAVMMTDWQGRIMLANPAAGILFREAPEKVLGKSAETVLVSPKLADLLLHSKEETRSAEIELADERILFASVRELRGKDAGVLGRVCVLWDITHFKKLDQLKSEFVSTVSHDLRAPLTLMRGYATMLSMVGSMNEQQKSFSQKILESVGGMSKLVDNLLDLGRIEAGVGLTLEAVDVQALIEDVIRAYRPQAVTRGLSLEAKIDPDLKMIEADGTLLRQALANLVDNAVKYTPADGAVRIVAEQLADRLRIQVIDSGAGIAPPDQARLFEKFYRAHTRETAREKGSGLGLAIVKSIVERHGGRVSVESRLGSGSSFEIELPSFVGRPANSTTQPKNASQSIIDQG